MLDFMGRVAEGTGENLFVVRDGVVATPPIVNILPGVTRQTVLEILDHEKIPVVIEHFGRDAIYTADECFVTGTAAEVTPVRELDRRTIGEGSPGRVTRHVQALYQAAVTGRLEWMRDEITTR
jgi:branched-chain amino acid aminotransferase